MFMVIVFVIPTAIRLEQYMCISKDEREANWVGERDQREGETREGNEQYDYQLGAYFPW